MEENKNNAVEKVENVIRNRHKKHNRAIKMSEKMSRTMDEKAERERMMAERRVELARIRAHKKAEKEKAKAMARREKNRRKAELNMKRQELKQARQMKIEERKAERERARQKRKTQNRGFGGWLAAVITLSVATLVLASVLTFTFLMPTASDGMLENTYRKSFYDTVKQVDNIDLNLSKVLATRDSSAMQKYLVDTAINSELAENELQQLPLHDESKYYTTKLINQIGDYSKYLNNKLADGEPLSQQDLDGLRALYNANKLFKASLGEMVNDMSGDYSFRSIIDGGDGNLVIGGFNDLQNLSVDYPELIYDGPFSDGINDREIKGLKGEEITDDKAKENFNKVFADYRLENVMTDGTTTGAIECYNVYGDKDGEQLYAQFSKKGGKLIMFAFSGSCNSTDIDQGSAIEKAQEFLTSLGMKNMQPVWVNLTGNVYTINFAFEQDGVIVYSDLVKVRVCAETSMVIGLEASSYYTNHTDRVIGSPTLSEKQAGAKVSDNIGIVTCRLALVPVGTKQEKLCYEFSGEYEGSTYYVYIDATNGRQVEMFKVIESTEGTLLI